MDKNLVYFKLLGAGFSNYWISWRLEAGVGVVFGSLLLAVSR